MKDNFKKVEGNKALKIHISRYPVFMKLGYYSRERLTGQEIFVSLEADVGDRFVTLNQDDLVHSVDYGKMIAAIESKLKDQEVKLVETVLSRLGTHLLSMFPLISKLYLQIEKPILPDGLGKGAQVSVSHLFTNDQSL